MTIFKTSSLASLCLTLLLFGALSNAQDAPQLTDIPPPDMASMDAESRGLLQGAVDYFAETRAQLRGRDLGLAFGRLGLHYLAHSQLASAVAAFRNASTLDDANYRWPYYLALAQSSAGNADRAIALYGLSLRLNPDNEAAATRLGLALIDAGKSSSARAILESAIEGDNQRNAAALAGLGRLALQQDQAAAAIDFYQRAIALQPEANALHAALEKAYELAGDREAAAQAATQAGGRLPQIDDPLVAMLYAHRQSSAQFIGMGDQAREQGQVAAASVFYDFAMAVNPRDPVPAERIAALRENAPAKAQSNPKTATDFFERGVFHAASDNDAGAVSDFNRAIELDADNVAARVFLANALMRMDQYSDAAVQYGMAGARDKNNAELRFRQGIAWMAAKRCERAETALLAGYELEPTALRLVQALARLYATCPVSDEKKGLALKYAQLLYNSQPTLETAETLAMVLAANGKYEDAADFQRQAIFEGLKSGRAQSDPSLSQNLELYVAGKSTQRAWPEDHQIFNPARPTPGT